MHSSCIAAQKGGILRVLCRARAVTTRAGEFSGVSAEEMQQKAKIDVPRTLLST